MKSPVTSGIADQDLMKKALPTVEDWLPMKNRMLPPRHYNMIFIDLGHNYLAAELDERS